MLFHLFQRLRGEVGAFNVFRYVSTRTMLATLTSLSITFLVAPWFIRRARARQLGMTNTHFVNPNGLPDSQHYSSARDLAILALAGGSRDQLQAVLVGGYYGAWIGAGDIARGDHLKARPAEQAAEGAGRYESALLSG